MEQMQPIELDDTDRRILVELTIDGRLSTRELAARVHRSLTPVFERVRRLEREGVISGYHAHVDLERLGLGFMVFCNVKLRQINTEIHAQFAELMNSFPEVVECYNVSGSYDYLLKVRVPDMRSYRDFVTERLGSLTMLESVHSVFVMDQVKHTSLPPVYLP